VSPTPDVRVAALLRDLGSRLRRGSHEAARQTAGSRRHATGLADVDALLGGGFPAGRLCEIAGPPSSGRTSIALALLAQATRAGEWTAFVDAADALDPTSAQTAGIALPRVLWVRPRDAREAARACARLLELRGFALIALDLAQPAHARQPLPSAAWQRLARAAAASGTSLVVLSQQRLTGAWSELALETRCARAYFRGAPALLEGIEIEACVARQRAGPARRVAAVRLCAASRAA
jgi:RecA/RadA recombinase